MDFRESIVYSVVKDKTKIIINPIQDAENILLKTESRRLGKNKDLEDFSSLQKKIPYDI